MAWAAAVALGAVFAGRGYAAKGDAPAASATPTPPPKSFPKSPDDPKPPVTLLGWKVETVAIHPTINTPSVVCALPDGRVLVAEHWLSNVGGKTPIDRIFCLYPDGHVTVFADGLYAVFGLAYVDGKVIVHHMPKFSVFTDDAQTGVGKDRKDILDQTGTPTIGGLNDHIPANIHLAMDGYLYMAVGDRGFYGAKSNVDGKAANLQGGGLVRIRPDGTDLEVYATGTRNHLDVSLTAEDEMFTYDNTDDGHGWWTRFTHMVDGGFYGYPWDYKATEDKNDPASKKSPKERDAAAPFQPYTLWRAAEYGGGSPTGAIGYNEDALPEEYRGNVFHCEWGKGKFQRFVVARDGGTFKVVKQEDLLSNGGKGGGDMRPTGTCVTTDGMGFWVTDWGYGGWMNKKEAGRLLKVTWTGKSLAAPKPAWYVPAAMGQTFTATTAELIDGLKHPAESVRLVAQRRVAERGQEAVGPLTALLNDASAPAHARWHAVWALDRIDGGKAGRAAVVGVAKDTKADASVRRQAIRQLGQRSAKEGTDAVVSALSDPDESIRFRAATALGRIGNAASVPALLKGLDDPANQKDLFTRYALFTALNRVGRADPAAWPAIVKGLESKSETVRANTSYALRNTYDEALAKALAEEVSTSHGATPEARAAALLALADIHRAVKPWAGSWWGTQPVGQSRPKKDVEWAGTQIVLGTIRESVKDADPAVRQAAVQAMQIAPDPAAADTLVEVFNKTQDVATRTSVLSALAANKSPKGAELVAGVLKDPASSPDLLAAAIDVAATTGDKASAGALVGLLDRNPPAKVLAPALAALGQVKDPSTAAAVAKHAGSSDDAVAMSAANALGQIGGDAAVTALTTALSDKRSEIRRSAAEGLGSLKAPKAAVPALVKAAQDKDGQVAQAAVSALAKTPTVDALDAYLAGVASKNAGLRQTATKALSAISTQALPLLEARAQAGQLSPDVLAAVQSVFDAATPLTIWQVLGPFDADKPDPFPGNDPAKYPAKTAELKGAEGKTIKWKSYTTRAERGMIDLNQLVRPGDHVNTFLLAEFTSAADRDVEVLIGSDDFDVVWLNGQKIDEDTNNSGWNYDERRVKAHVKAGKNTVLARVGNDSGPYQFSLAVSGDRKGKLFEPVAAATKKLDRDGYGKFALDHKGNVENGGKVFHNVQAVGCVKCHQVAPNDGGGTIGPSLQGVGAKYDRVKLVESVLYPSKQIFDGYEQWLVKTKDGEGQWGVIRTEDDREITMYDSGAQKIVIKKSDVASRKKGDISLMPEGLEQGLTPQELADLISYLESQKDKPAEAPKGGK